MKNWSSNLGIWAFLVGLLLAAVLALVSMFTGPNVPALALAALALLGILVGLLNVAASEVQKFLITMIAFILSMSVLRSVFMSYAQWPIMVGFATFFELLSVFLGAAAVVVALESLYLLAKD